MAVPCSFREPLHIPSAKTLDIPDNKFKRVEIVRCHCIESYIEEHKSPLEKSVDSVGCPKSVLNEASVHINLPPATLWTLC